MSSFVSCISVFLIVFCLGIAGWGLTEWGKARQDPSRALRLIHYAEAWTRMMVGGCLAAASFVLLVVANDTASDIPTANAILNAFIIPCIGFGVATCALTVARHVVLVRALWQARQPGEGQRQDG